MKSNERQPWLKYPIGILFLVFLMSFAIVDELWPKRERSELENRTLAQFPKFTLAGLLEKNSDQTWMSQYSEYTQDQVALRDQWINLKSLSEAALLKTENNDVWFGSDNYLFAVMVSIDEKLFDRNLTALERMSQRHPGKVDIMIAPSASLILEQYLPWRAPIADEGAYLDQIDERLGSVATVYDLRPVLNAHDEEYIYYRTDHHWTTYGAYLAYCSYVESKGLTPMDTDQVPAVEVGDFYGTNYAKARRLGAVSDTITYYQLPNALTIHNLNAQGEAVEEMGALYNLSDFDTYDKYKAFLRGNNGYSTLKGDGEGSILVVKDSYANCFVPFLVANYADIGIVDFRYTIEKIDSLVERGNYDRILVLYSFQGFTTDTQLAGRIATA